MGNISPLSQSLPKTTPSEEGARLSLHHPPAPRTTPGLPSHHHYPGSTALDRLARLAPALIKPLPPGRLRPLPRTVSPLSGGRTTNPCKCSGFPFVVALFCPNPGHFRPEESRLDKEISLALRHALGQLPDEEQPGWNMAEHGGARHRGGGARSRLCAAAASRGFLPSAASVPPTGGPLGDITTCACNKGGSSTTVGQKSWICIDFYKKRVKSPADFSINAVFN